MQEERWWGMSKEAMKLALEALEGVEALLSSMGLTHLIIYGDAEKAITNLSQALAEQPAPMIRGDIRDGLVDDEPAQQEPVAFSQFLSDVVTAAGLLSHGKTDKSLAARISEFAFRLRTSPQPAQQETVAWYRDEDGIRIYYESKVWDNATPLYTSPPAQRTWVGLTQEEFRDFATTYEYGTGGLIRAIEAKLKEKNT